MYKLSVLNIYGLIFLCFIIVVGVIYNLILDRKTDREIAQLDAMFEEQDKQRKEYFARLEREHYAREKSN